MKILLKAFLLTAPINFVYAAEGQKSAGLPQMDIATFPSQLFWLVITFSLLYLFMWKFVIPRLGATIEERRDKISNDINDADNLNTEATDILKKYDQKEIKMTGLLSLKPKLYVCNVEEENISKGNNHTKSFISTYGESNTIIISAEIENQINQLSNEEKVNYMKMIGSDETGLKLMIKKGYDILELDTFFTSGPEETRAWTIKKNSTAPNAAGKIHSDFEKGFIKAETVSYLDFINNQGWTQSRSSGKMRLEGKDYIVKDGDVLNFRFNT